MNIEHLDIEGCFIVQLNDFKDTRGRFVKTYHSLDCSGTPLENFELAEEFYSISKKGVLRGVHFQEPPAAHDKLVYCIDGKVLDFFVDLRKDSATFKKSIAITLNSEAPQLLYLPKGIGHGFLTTSDSATLVYKTDHVYSPENDKGVHWASLGLKELEGDFLVSERDSSFPDLDEYESGF